MSLSQSAPRPLVLADLWVGGRVRSAVLVALGAVTTGLAAQVVIPLPGTPVPFTLQTLAVLLTGTVLGPRLGAVSMSAYVGLGLVGVPWFAGRASGFHVATFGYLLGFVVAAWVCGALARRSADRRLTGAVLSMVVGNLVIYGLGVSVLAWSLSVSVPTAISIGVVPFLAGDVLKIVLAGGLLPSLWSATGLQD